MSSLLLLLSAFFHAAWNALVKQSRFPHFFLIGLTLINAFLTTLLVALPLTPFSWPSRQAFFWGILAGFFEGAYTVTLGLTFTQNTLGASYAIMRGGALLITWFFSVLFLKETFSWPIGLGLGCVLVGLGLVSPRTFTPASSILRSFYLSSFWKSNPYAYVCALWIAGYHLCYGQALEHGIPPIPLLSLSLLSSLPVLGYFYPRQTLVTAWRQELRTRWPWVLGASLLSTLSFLIFLFGLQHTHPGLALTLRNTSVIFAQFLAKGLGEKISLAQGLGAFWITMGTLLVRFFSHQET